MNGNPVGINTPLEPNCDITIEPSTEGSEADFSIEQLDEYTDSALTFIVNGREIRCAKFVEVNGKLEPGSYRIQENDVIEMRNYYTLAQLAEFMDVRLDLEKELLVNNRPADPETLVYENFEVEWSVLSFESVAEEHSVQQAFQETAPAPGSEDETGIAGVEMAQEIETEPAENTGFGTGAADSRLTGDTAGIDANQALGNGTAIVVAVNGRPVRMDKKDSYVFVDIFDYIDFDLSQSRGRGIVTKINGVDAQFMQGLQNGDKLDIYWKEN